MYKWEGCLSYDWAQQNVTRNKEKGKYLKEFKMRT